MADARPQGSGPIATADDGWQPTQVAALAVVAVAGLLVSLTQSLLIPVLPTIAADLGSGPGTTEWLLTSTLLVAAVSVPTFGRLGDLYGKRLMLLVSAAMLVVGSLICALSHDIGTMILGRAVVGMSTAAIPLGISLISIVLPPRRAGSGVALVSATLGIGGALGLPLAGFIGEHYDYHLLFWICVVGGVVSFVGTLLLLKEPAERATGRFDLPGTALLAIGLVALLLPLSKASDWGWGSGRTLGLLAVAVVVLVVFVLAERAMRSPLVDVRANAAPALLLTNVASLCVGFALFASLIGTASYVQAPEASGYGFGTSVVVSGLCLLPSGVAMILLSPVSASMTRRFGPKITLCVGASIVALGFLGRIVFTGSLWEIIVFTTVVGAGTGIAYAAMPALISLGAPHSELAAANGLNALFRSVGSSLASAVGGTLLASQVIVLGSAVLPSLGAYRILFAACAGAALLGAVIALLVPKARARAADTAAAAPARV